MKPRRYRLANRRLVHYARWGGLAGWYQTACGYSVRTKGAAKNDQTTDAVTCKRCLKSMGES